MQLRDGCEPLSRSMELKAGEWARSTSAAVKINGYVMLPPFDEGMIPLAPRFRLPPEVGVLKPLELFLLQLCPLSTSEGEGEGVAAVVPFRGVSLLVGGGVAGTSGGVDGSLDGISGEIEVGQIRIPMWTYSSLLAMVEWRLDGRMAPAAAGSHLSLGGMREPKHSTH